VAGSLEVAVRARARLGEGPTWDPATGTLLWVDILASEVHRLDPGGGDVVVVRAPQHVGAAKPRAGGWLVTWAEDGCRGNDAAVDAGGRLWAGTMRYDEAPGGGRLYRVDALGEVVTVLPEASVSNGIGWSPDGRLMYYVDSPTRRVDVFDVDRETGLVARRRPFVDLARAAGFPDGLAVDADGGVWVALWDGGAVHRYTPAGVLDRVIGVPAARTTACAFGGSGLGDLYVTTATVGLDPERLAAEPLAGSVFVLPGAGSGLPGHAFAG
jgi:sugar lactone lactonase YvrE